MNWKILWSLLRQCNCITVSRFHETSYLHSFCWFTLIYISMTNLIFLPVFVSPYETGDTWWERICPAICQPTRYCQKFGYVLWFIWNVKNDLYMLPRKSPACGVPPWQLNYWIPVNLIMSSGGKQGEKVGFFFKPGESIEIFMLMLWGDITVYIKYEMLCRKTNIALALQRQMV